MKNSTHKLALPLFTCLVIACWLMMLYPLVSSYAKPMDFHKTTLHTYLIKLMPQGWAFFTRSPRENQVLVYSYEQEKLIPLNLRNASLSNWLGLLRYNRSVGADLDKLLAKVGKTQYLPFVGDIKANIPETALPIPWDNDFTILQKGEYVVVQYQTLPFAFVPYQQEENIPKLIARLNVE